MKNFHAKELSKFFEVEVLNVSTLVECLMIKSQGLNYNTL